MKEITEELIQHLYNVRSGINPIKWDDIFDTEEELIQALFHEKIYTDEDNVPMHKWCRGYDFIKGFRRYYNKHGKLTDKQMTQLKRLASGIAFKIYCED